MVIPLDFPKGGCTFPWTWLTTKSTALGLTCLPDPHYLGPSGWPSSSTLILTCLSNSRYLKHDWLSSSSTLGLTCLPYSCYLELGGLPSPYILSLTCWPILPWTWLNAKSKYLGSNMFFRLTLPHSIGCVKGGWSFSWACPRLGTLLITIVFGFD